MPIGVGNSEFFSQLGYDPSGIGIHILFFLSGALTLRSLERHGSVKKFIISRFMRNIPMLAIFTLAVVLLVYPLLGVMTGDGAAITKKLASYFVLTVSCLAPGQVLPGLLDEAKYMCLIQGSIWTFRWGFAAYIASIIGYKIGVFNDRRIILGVTALVGILFFVASMGRAYWSIDIFALPELALRLSWAFLAGMTVYAWQDKLPKRASIRAVLLTSIAILAIFWYNFLPWTPAIEMLLNGFWAYTCWLIITSRTPKLNALNHWPNLTIGIYLSNWPVSQLILLSDPSMGSWNLIGMSVPISILIAMAVHTLLCKKLHEWTRNLSGTQVAAQTA